MVKFWQTADDFYQRKIGKNFSEFNIEATVASEIEKAFKAASEYKVATGDTMAGSEGGWIFFKHTNTQICYGLLFTKVYGIVIMRRSGITSTWTFYRLFSI